MKYLFPILLLCLVHLSYGQDTLDVEPKEKFIEKINFIKDVDFFKYIGDSKSKCDGSSFDKITCQQYEGRTIRNINIEILDPFGHISTEDLKRPKFYNLADKLHQSTPERMVEHQLLFKEGDEFKTNQISASQQILFENEIFRDAQIMVYEDPTDPTFVDIYVLVQDLWSWSFWGEVTDKHVGGKLIFNKFAGLPHKFIGGINFNYDKTNLFTGSLAYDYRNIKRTFIDVSASAVQDWERYSYELQVQRGFFSTQPQWAGSVSLGWYRDYFEDYDDQAFRNAQDYWLARSFPFKVNKTDNLNFVLAGRMTREFYNNPPERATVEYDDVKFTNTNSYLVGIGIANRNYVREKNIFDFFPYRNLPTGFNAQLIGGVIYRSDLATRGYLGSSFNHSLMTCAGYFQEELAVGSYINNGLEQITFHIKSKYFTHRYPLKEWGVRQYIYQSLVLGFLRPEGQDINLGNGTVKGLRQNYNGNSYYSLNLETEIQSPIKFMGFQARLFVFADLGIQGNNTNVPLGGAHFYHAYGIGARLNNWKLGIGYLELAVAYYPNTAGLENNPVQFLQNFGNRNVIEPNNLYSKGSVTTVN